MVQRWQEPVAEQVAVTLVREGEVPAGYRHVFDGIDGHDQPVSLVHEDSAPLRRMAIFDIVVNNADRKGGHVLPMPDGHRFGVDHGVSFHVDDKLRTVLWGWAREPLDPEDAAGLRSLLEQLGTATSELVAALTELLAGDELAATVARCELLLRRDVMPMPSGGRPSIPWPAF
jgi:uncharacterized repeat protein (TIGR03843 family)